MAEARRTNIYDQALIQEVREAVNILTLLEDEYDLVFEEGKNGWWQTNCPFPDHRDTDPSFGINVESQSFSCFGCGRKGDIFAFVRLIEGIPFYQALEKLKTIAGIESSSDEEAGHRRVLRTIEATTEEFLNRCAETQLPGGISMPQYMRSLAERLRAYEARTEYDEAETQWVDQLYKEVDALAMADEQVAMTKLWNTLAKRISERFANWKHEFGQ